MKGIHNIFKRNNIVFVYRTLKSGYRNNPKMRGAKFLGIAETVEKYCLYDTYYDYPALAENINEFCICGELYTVSDDKVTELDSFEGAPNLFYRKEIDIIINASIVKAWVYFFNFTEINFEQDIKNKIKGKKWIF